MLYSEGIGDARRMPTREEAICLQRFLDGEGSAIFEITRTENERLASASYCEETVRVRLSNNDVLAIPEQHNIVLLTSEGVGYQLWMQVAN